MHFTLFSCFFRPTNRTTNVMTTNTSKHSPTEYNVRCGVIISSKRYACTHLRCMLDVPENSCVPLLTVSLSRRRRRRYFTDAAAAEKKSIGAPPPPVKITRRAAAEILTVRALLSIYTPPKRTHSAVDWSSFKSLRNHKLILSPGLVSSASDNPKRFWQSTNSYTANPPHRYPPLLLALHFHKQNIQTPSFSHQQPCYIISTLTLSSCHSP